MKTVGVRELKNRLSEYLREVRGGEAVLVTDRGEVIAEVRAPGAAVSDPSIPPGLAALAKRGLVTLASTRGHRVYPAVTPFGKIPSSQELLDETRGTR